MKVVVDIPEILLDRIKSAKCIPDMYGSDIVNTVVCVSNATPYEERPHGEWIKGKEISRTMLCDETLCIDYENFTCSACGLVLDRLLYHVDGSPFYKFCPKCGADMREGE